jgi:uncharacterized membrane protein YbhN (UPF0104 family)
MALLRYWRLAVAAALLGFLWHWLDGEAALAYLGRADPRWLAVALVLLSTQIVLSAARWRLTAARLGKAIPPGRAVGEYYLSVFGNMVLPGGVVGDAGRAVRARHGSGIGVAVQSVVIERLSGQLMLMLVLVPGLLLWPGWAGLGLSILAAIGICVLALRLGPGLLRRAGDTLARVWLRGGAWRKQLGLSLAIVAANVGAFAACAAAVGAPLPPLAVPVVIPLTLAAMILPVTVGGWGVREAAASLLWPIAGLAAEGGTAAAIAYGLVMLAASLPGAVVLFRSGRGRGREHAP